MTPLRRLATTVATVTAVTAATVAVPAAVAPAEARAALSCASRVIGFTTGNKAVIRDVRNRTVTYTKASATALPFKVRGAAFFSQNITPTTIDVSVTTVNDDGRARLVDISDPERTTADSPLATDWTSMKNSSFYPRLIANDGRYHVFMIDKAGRLKRWTTYITSTGKLLWGDPVLVRKGMGGAKTLSFGGRFTVAGVKTDLLWTTTRTGALKQLQVPAKRIKRSKLLTVKKGGFADVTSLSPGTCGDKPGVGSLIAIERGNNRARWFTISRQTAPKAANLVNHGVVRGNVTWKLTATI